MHSSPDAHFKAFDGVASICMGIYTWWNTKYKERYSIIKQDHSLSKQNGMHVLQLASIQE